MKWEIICRNKKTELIVSKSPKTWDNQEVAQLNADALNEGQNVFHYYVEAIPAKDKP